MRIYVSTFFKNMNFEYLHAFSGTGVAFVCALYELFLNEKFRGVGTGWVDWAFLHLGCPPNVWQTQGIENHIICSQRFIFTIWPPISRLHPTPLIIQSNNLQQQAPVIINHGQYCLLELLFRYLINQHLFLTQKLSMKGAQNVRIINYLANQSW